MRNPGGTPPRHLLEHEEPLKGNAQMILLVPLPLSLPLSLSHGLKPPNSFFPRLIINDYTPFFKVFASFSELIHASQGGLYRLRKKVKLLLFEACFQASNSSNIVIITGIYGGCVHE